MNDHMQAIEWLDNMGILITGSGPANHAAAASDLQEIGIWFCEPPKTNMLDCSAPIGQPQADSAGFDDDKRRERNDWFWRLISFKPWLRLRGVLGAR